MKNWIVLVFLVFLTNSSIIQHTDFLQVQQILLNCKYYSKDQCLICDDGYYMDLDGICVAQAKQRGISLKSQVQIEQILPSIYPCVGLSCGKSFNFANEQKLQQFLLKYQNNLSRVKQSNTQHGQSQPLSIIEQKLSSQPQFIKKDSSSPFSSINYFQTSKTQLTAKQVKNNQQRDMDQADLLKTDGTYIYTISDTVLSIIQSFPTLKAKIVSEIQLQFKPQDLFIQEDYLALIGTLDEESKLGQRTKQSITYVKVYNIENKKIPFLIKEIRIEGRYLNGRKTQDGFINILSIEKFQNRKIQYPWYIIGSQKINTDLKSIFLYEKDYYDPNFVNIFSFDLKNANQINNHNLVSIITQTVEVIYMNQNHIYLTFQNYQINNYNDFTAIHKVFIWKKIIIPLADTIVRGKINNQFSLNQYEGVLRIATTSNNPTTNHIFCLDNNLRQIGKINNIASGQSIFSTRYVQKRLYLVTFRQIDRLTIISLQDHKNPKLLGEPKITEFSKYLYPYDQNIIIGLEKKSNNQGLKLALFNVTDVQNPIQSASFHIQQKYISSIAKQQHKAFLFQKSKNLIIIPGMYNSDDDKFNGVFVFYVDEDQIYLRGVVNHYNEDDDDIFEENRVERSFSIEDFLYTKSLCKIRINLIQDLHGIKDIDIPCRKNAQQIQKDQFIDQIIWPTLKINK